MVDLMNRETKFSNAEFAALRRNEEGRILDDFDFVWIWATDAQKERMHNDDQSRGIDLDEELEFMAAEFF